MVHPALGLRNPQRSPRALLLARLRNRAWDPYKSRHFQQFPAFGGPQLEMVDTKWYIFDPSPTFVEFQGCWFLCYLDVFEGWIFTYWLFLLGIWPLCFFCPFDGRMHLFCSQSRHLSCSWLPSLSLSCSRKGHIPSFVNATVCIGLCFIFACSDSDKRYACWTLFWHEVPIHRIFTYLSLCVFFLGVEVVDICWTHSFSSSSFFSSVFLSCLTVLAFRPHLAECLISAWCFGRSLLKQMTMAYIQLTQWIVLGRGKVENLQWKMLSFLLFVHSFLPATAPFPLQISKNGARMSGFSSFVPSLFSPRFLIYQFLRFSFPLEL